jgi:hypothetical protein
MKTHWKKLQNPDYFGSWSIPENEDLILTINFVQVEAVTNPSGRSEQLPVIHFKEHVKPLVLNVTNSQQIQLLHGSPYVEDWNGKQIQVYKDYTKFAGKEVECVRIRGKIPNLKKPSFTPSHKNWDKAINKILAGEGTIEGLKEKFELTEEDEILIKESIQKELENA